MSKAPPRKPFTAAQKREILHRQRKRILVFCAECRREIARFNPHEKRVTKQFTVTTPFDYDHERARELLGEDTADNGRAICRETCHKAKTAKDVQIISKARRQAGERGSQYHRRKEKGSRLKGRGFQKRLTRKFNGQVVERSAP
ncbi:MAG: hypothetical protein AB7J28_15500 [Hyphomonadaceae bacterium]